MYLIINAAATFLTFGHLHSATIVSRLPHMPTTIIRIVITAANVRSGRENLKNVCDCFIRFIRFIGGIWLVQKVSAFRNIIRHETVTPQLTSMGHFTHELMNFPQILNKLKKRIEVMLRAFHCFNIIFLPNFLITSNIRNFLHFFSFRKVS